MLKEMQPIDVESLLAKAKKPAELALKLHPYYHGKIETVLKCPVRDYHDFAIWYTPGVAAPCREIAANPDKVYEHTNKGNSVAIISDATRVLGLGDIGPKAGLPVMEGKALLFKYLGGVDAVPVMLNTKDPDKIIEIVLNLQAGFGGVNLEDISQPKCFRILKTLRQQAEIPIWHDDQQGTATVTLAALMNALRVVGKEKSEIRIAFIGCGGANVACSRLLFAWGVDPAKCIMVDSKGILGMHRRDLEAQKDIFEDKWRLCRITNAVGLEGGIAQAMDGADVMIGFSQSGPGVILSEWISAMARDPIVFSCANPVPEIWPWEAKTGGSRIVATGRSDFPNQLNNSLGFPGIFRGTLDVRARIITDEMCFAAAQALANQIGDRLDAEHILPTMNDWEVYPREAAAVGVKAQEQGVARFKMSYDEIFANAKAIIKRSRDLTHSMMQHGFIKEVMQD